MPIAGTESCTVMVLVQVRVALSSTFSTTVYVPGFLKIFEGDLLALVVPSPKFQAQSSPFSVVLLNRTVSPIAGSSGEYENSTSFDLHDAISIKMQIIHVSFCFIFFFYLQWKNAIASYGEGNSAPLYSTFSVGKTPTLFEPRKNSLNSRLRIRVAEVKPMYRGIGSVPSELPLGVMA